MRREGQSLPPRRLLGHEDDFLPPPPIHAGRASAPSGPCPWGVPQAAPNHPGLSLARAGPGTKAVHPHPVGACRLPHCPLLGSLPPSLPSARQPPPDVPAEHDPSWMFLEFMGGEPHTGRGFPRPGSPTPWPACSPEKGPGTSYFPSPEARGFPHYHMNGAHTAPSTRANNLASKLT